MILLAIDTSTDRGLLALMDHDGTIRQATTDAKRRHGRDLIARLKALLAEASIAADQVEAIAVGLGPGSYTGARVGVTAAKTLAYANGAILVGLDSLLIIGRNAPPEVGRIWSIADAQRGDIYTAELIRSRPGAVPLPASETRVEPIADWSARLEPGDLVMGPALELPRIADRIPEAFRPPAEVVHLPEAEPLIAMAAEVIAAGRRDDPWTIEPLYLRRSSAEDLWEARTSTRMPLPSPGATP